LSKSDFHPKQISNFKTNNYKVNGDIELISELKSLANEIKERGTKLEEFCSIIQEENNKSFKIPHFLENFIIDNFLISTPIKAAFLSSTSVAAVDGGVAIGSLTGIDIIGIKATAVCFNYTKNSLNRVKYFPKKHQDIKIIPCFQNLSKTELNHFSSLKRSIYELKTALDLLNESPTSLDYLLIDGTFQLKRLINSNLEINKLQGQYFAYLRKLEKKASGLDTKLAFIVKDTRLNIFTQLISQLLPHIIDSIPALYNIDYRVLVESLRDSNLFFQLLPEKSRSFIIDRSFNQQEQVELNFKSYSFFLKVVKHDNPLRIDFIGKNYFEKSEITNFANELSQILLSLSEFSSFFSLPAPIIEADSRSRISLKEFNMLIEILQSLTFGSSYYTKSLKRSSSPFRF